MLISVLGSGSKGNCTYISEGDDAILIDAGLNWKQTKLRAEEKNLDLRKIKAIFVTHIHCDHIGQSYLVASKLGEKVKVWVNEGVKRQLQKNTTTKGYTDDRTELLRPLVKAKENGTCFDIRTWKLSHDTFQTTRTITNGFGIKSTLTGASVAVITDTGVIGKGIRANLACYGIIILESNYDLDMLMNGEYPEKLKARIDSDIGHLSNDYTAQFVNTLDPSVTKHVILAHISEDNNSIEKIKETFGNIVCDGSVMVHLASQTKGSSIFYID